MTTEDLPDERLAPIVVTHDGLTHDALTDEAARSVVAAKQREVEAALAALLPRMLAEGGQVRVEIPADHGDADVFVHGMSAALMQAVLALV
jgi:hypothetical protein